ncbi:MAG TPA: LCP family protein [Nocardioidaceae bacterium]|nr:LCP family protein [Nocardioidaceae bacterium]
MPPAFPERKPELARVRFRRALALLLMTLLLPGSAQLVAGNKRVGRMALRIFLTLLGVLVFLVVLTVLWHGFAFWAAANTTLLGFVRLLLCAIAIGWALLFFDAWRLGQPLGLEQRQRLAMVGLNGVLCFSVAGSLLFASHLVAVQRGLIGTMFDHHKVTKAHDGRYNVLLLGGDSGSDRWGLRPDSITVASIDQETGRTILFGLPRNMLNFPFRKGSVMAQQFPHGYDCGTSCELNSLATYAADNKALFKGYADPGVEATEEAVEGITGLRINYYAMVNLQGFRSLVQAMGGLELNVRDRIPIGGVGGPITGYLEPGIQRLNGFQTLWFARSRESADDYSRMARQKCVMSAMLHQLSPKTVITKFQGIAQASEKLVTTDLPASELDNFAQLALKARSMPVSTVSFVPPAIDTSHPDVAKIQKMIAHAIKKSLAKDEKHPARAAHTGVRASVAGHAVVEHPTRGTGFSTKKDPSGSTVGGSLGNMHDGYAANSATDLSHAC